MTGVLIQWKSVFPDTEAQRKGGAKTQETSSQTKKRPNRSYFSLQKEPTQA